MNLTRKQKEKLHNEIKSMRNSVKKNQIQIEQLTQTNTQLYQEVEQQVNK